VGIVIGAISTRINTIAERWVRSARTECLARIFIFNERHLRQALAEYVSYFNHWRPPGPVGRRAAGRLGRSSGLARSIWDNDYLV
jgi:transposase InsO family protein